MTQIKAKDCKCSKCVKRAVAFWPAIDPDIKSSPYCRPCLDVLKIELMIEIHNAETKQKP